MNLMDKLTLKIKNPLELDSGILPSISFSGKGIQVGRKAGNDWILPDSTRHISGAHFEIICEAGRYLLRDVSTNGTFVNGMRQSLENTCEVRDHDQIKVGHYVIEVSLDPAIIPAVIPPVVVAPEPAEVPLLPDLEPQPDLSTGATPEIVHELIPDFDLMAPSLPEPEPELEPFPELEPEPEKTPPDSAPIADTPFEPFSDLKSTIDGESVEEEPTPTPVAQVVAPVLVPSMSRNVQSPPSGASMTSAPSNQTRRPNTQGPNTQAPKTKNHAQIPDFASLMAKKTGMMGVSGPPIGGRSALLSAASVSRPPSKISSPPVFTSKPKSIQEAPAPNPDVMPETPVQAMPVLQLGPNLVTRSYPPSKPKPDQKPEPTLEPSVVTHITKIMTTQSQGLGERFGDLSLAPKSVPVVAPAPVVSAPTAPILPTPAPPQPITPVAAQSAPKPAERPQNASPTPNGTPDVFLRGFLAGAGIDDANALEIPIEDLGYMLGQCARIGTQEMMEMLQDRAAVKFLVSQEDRTMQVATGNNPMKFMSDAEQAFETMFVKPRSGYLGGDAGFKNALTDIRLHQAALMAAVQPALADMLNGLAPSEIEEDTGGARLGGAGRKYWNEYSKRWKSRAAQGENGMLDAFLAALARRYAEALDKHI